VWQWNHEPFGNDAPLGSFTYELRFPGQFFDQATYLHYNYFRDYDPRTGRYLESDPIGLAGGVNTYAYAGSNPLTRIDPQGLQEVVIPWDEPRTPPTEMAGSTIIDPVLPIPDTGSPQQCKPDDKCPQLIQALNALSADLKDQYNDIIYNPLNLPPTGRMSVAGHQQKYRQDQGRLRNLLNRAAAGSRLRAVRGAADLLRLGVGLLDRIEHRFWVGRLSHGVCFLIDPVANERIIPAGLFQQLDHLRRLLLAQDGQLQGELLAELGKLVLTPLSGQYQDDDVERYQRDRTAQAGKRESDRWGDSQARRQADLE
jgi:RHS repeat-associated protein